MYRIFFLGFTLICLISCKTKVTVEDKDGNSFQLKLSDLELASNEKEEQIEKQIIDNVNTFLQTNNSSIVRNYWFLCDTINIKPIRNYKVKHKNENIDIHLNLKTVSIRPIPGTYLISEGPFAEYKISNDSLGVLHSYVIDLNLTENYQISDYKATLRFSKEINGIDKETFKHTIREGDNYNIESNIITNNWW
ncbi:hypothetical protein [Carboxylicivirga linearis]|uniref:Lipoprotein n=1 Tax=Carboxylicivirga linearis TaxID=1628157 RepID=A0ABS5K126_9BACT|nr:hypothetical protein [Carboxylicivirga linearis]MBS2100834.1 hypothetical protein [Carboxylicivirga linearis]